MQPARWSDPSGRLARNSKAGARPGTRAPSENPVPDVTLQTEENPAAALPEPQPTEAPVPGPSSMIVFESVTKVYDPDVRALRELSLIHI